MLLFLYIIGIISLFVGIVIAWDANPRDYSWGLLLLVDLFHVVVTFGALWRLLDYVPTALRTPAPSFILRLLGLHVN